MDSEIELLLIAVPISLAVGVLVASADHLKFFDVGSPYATSFWLFGYATGIISLMLWNRYGSKHAMETAKSLVKIGATK